MEELGLNFLGDVPVGERGGAPAGERNVQIHEFVSLFEADFSKRLSSDDVALSRVGRYDFGWSCMQKSIVGYLVGDMDHDVAWLDIHMNHASLMCKIQC